MTSAIALIAFSLLPPASSHDRVIRLLNQDSEPNEYAVSPFAQLLHEPECLLQGVVEGMRRVRVGMAYKEVNRLLRVDSLQFSMVSGSSFGFTSVYRVGSSHSLRLRCDPDHRYLHWAVLYRDGKVIERVGP